MSDQTRLSTTRIPVKRDVWITLGFLFIFAVFVMSVLIVPDNERWYLYLLIIPVTLFLVWLYLGTFYVFEDNYLVCQSGPFREEIYYNKIKSLRLCENFLSSMALSRERIEIKQHDKGYITGTTYISPVDREQFLAKLKQRCRNLDD